MIALSLAGYHADHSAYPVELQALVPKYLDKVPLDPFTQKPLVYKRQGEGYILYSVSANMHDDDGIDTDDQPLLDIVVQTK